MCTPRSRYNRCYVFFLATMGFTGIAIAAEQTYVREYIYQASEADSKISARTIALQEVKRELLGELGTHVTALVKIKSSSDGTTLGKEEIETLSAGVTRVEILDEKWNGVVYVLKAQIKADPEDVLKNLHKMLDADRKQKQISQLSTDLSKIQTEKIQIAESLTQSKKETDAALAEIARLKKQLEEKQTDASRQTLQTAYQQQVDQLKLNELFDSALQFLDKGNFAEAARLFRKAAEQGHAVAQYNLGIAYAEGDGVSRDTKQSVYWWQKAAEQGHATAQYNLGVGYAEGLGLVRDAKQAVYWYRKAADQGMVAAQNNLGLMYKSGEGVVRDAQQSIFWLQKAAENGHVDSMFNLAGMYDRGELIARDVKRAVYWYRKAAELGDASSQYTLGWKYVTGEGVEPDAKQRVFWWQKSAEQGFAEAQVGLGFSYQRGDGVERDTNKALSWFRKAAEQGDAEAQYILGRTYDKGLIVARDIKQAAYWYQKAAEQGHDRAREILIKQQE